MSRLEGFAIADVDVNVLSDLKLRRLRASLDEAEANATTLLYLAVVLSSWRDGERLAAIEALSPVAATPDRIAILQVVGLLDRDGLLPEHVWEGWFRPAWDRRESKRAGGVEGNKRRWSAKARPSPTESASDTATESHPDSDSVSPSLRPSSPASPGRHGRPGKETVVVSRPNGHAPAAPFCACGAPNEGPHRSTCTLIPATSTP
jgi:hypothetical protein